MEELSRVYNSINNYYYQVNILMLRSGLRDKPTNKNLLPPSAKPFSGLQSWKPDVQKLCRQKSTVSTTSQSIVHTQGIESQDSNCSKSSNSIKIPNFDNKLYLAESLLSKESSFSQIQSKIQMILQNFHEEDSSDIFFPKRQEQKIQNLSKLKETTCFDVQMQRGRMNKENFPLNNEKVSKQRTRSQSLYQSALRDISQQQNSLNISNCSSTLEKQVNFDKNFRQNSLRNEIMLQTLQKQYLSLKIAQGQIFFDESMKRPQILKKTRKNRLKTLPSKLMVDESCIQKCRFLESFKKQIVLDKQFRKAKSWFKSYKKQHKWWLLERQLKKRKLWMHDLGMKAIFSIRNEEENPFESVSEQLFSVKYLVETFLKAEEHWSSEICNSFDYKLLKKQGFLEENIAWNKKDYISLEDLTRYANLELKSFFHNRELQLIYFRLKNTEQLQFFDFMQTISKTAN